MPTLTRQLLLTGAEWLGVISVTMIIGLSPAFQRRRPLIFRYPRREGLVALGLYLLLLALTSVAAAFDYRLPDRMLLPLIPLPVFLFDLGQLLQQVTLAVIIALPFLLALIVRSQPALSAGFARPLLWPGVELGIALALMTIFITGKTYDILSGLQPGHLRYLAASLVLATAEEFAFRGYIQLRLVAWLGETRGWLLASALFALWRLPLALVTGPIAFSDLLGRLAYFLAFGLLLGWVMRKSGSALAPALYHAVHSWVLVI